MTQAELAARIGVRGVNERTVRRWEQGTFPRRHQGALEAILGIRLDDDPPEFDDPTARRVWNLKGLSEETRRKVIDEIYRDERQAG